MKKLYSSSVILITLNVAVPALATSMAGLFGGESIIVHDKIFSNWELAYLDSGIPEPDLSLVEIIALDNDALNPGIRYETNGQFFVEGDGYLGMAFSYDVATISGLPLIKDNSLDLTGFLFEGEGPLLKYKDVWYTRSVRFSMTKLQMLASNLESANY